MRSTRIRASFAAAGACLALSASAGAAAPAPPPPSNWSTYGHDDLNTRTNPSPGDISAASVGTLRSRWSKAGLIGVVGTPTVSGGTAYFGTLSGSVWAVEASTGRPLWKTTVSSGVIGAITIAGSSLYVGCGNELYKLDRSTGAITWVAVTNHNQFAQISASPVVVGNLVIEGTASYEVAVRSTSYTFQGSIGAFKTSTGRQVWNFVTTANDTTSGAGEGIWSTPAIAANLGLLFVGTGQNLSPPPGPLEDALLAIDIKSGRLRWVRQGYTDDVFSAGYPEGHDYDFGASPNLWFAHGREVVGDGEKSGYYEALDAKSGRILWRTKLTAGGPFGGVLGSAAYVDGRLIVTANVGGAQPERSEVFALDPRDGAIEWSRGLQGNIYGPVSAIPRVAFVGTDTDTMVALSTRSGKVLWQHQAPGPVASGPSIVAGAVLWGYGFTLFNGPGPGGIVSLVTAKTRSG